jgi:hypothetical protein
MPFNEKQLLVQDEFVPPSEQAEIAKARRMVAADNALVILFLPALRRMGFGNRAVTGQPTAPPRATRSRVGN